jgi:CelD/BcsL family acetyltransferase involved in cellulose biosynthesis
VDLDTYTQASELERLGGEWTQLLSTSFTNSLFLSHDWMQTWWRHFGEGADLRVLVLRGLEGQALGIAPLLIRNSCLVPNEPVPDISIETEPALCPDVRRRSVHLLGGTEVSDYLDIIAPGQLCDAVWQAAFEHLAAHGDWQIMDLRNLPAASPSIPAVQRLAEEHGWSPIVVHEDVCPVIDLPETWDRYLDVRLDKKKRHELRRKIRKAEAEADVHWAWVEPQNVDVGMQIFFELHRASAPEKDSFMTRRMEAFFEDIASVTQACGWLRLAVLRFDGQAVATYLCFDSGLDRLVYNSGFDVSTYGHLSPGIVLLGYLINDAIRRGLRRFDFLQGNERYKYDLGGVDTRLTRIFVSRT